MAIVRFLGGVPVVLSINKKLVLHTLRYFLHAKLPFLTYQIMKCQFFQWIAKREGTQRPHINFIESLNRPI